MPYSRVRPPHDPFNAMIPSTTVSTSLRSSTSPMPSTVPFVLVFSAAPFFAPPPPSSLYNLRTFAMSVVRCSDSSVKGIGVPSTETRRCDCTAEKVGAGAEESVVTFATLMARRERVVSEMPKRRKESAICRG